MDLCLFGCGGRGGGGYDSSITKGCDFSFTPHYDFGPASKTDDDRAKS